VNEPDEESSRRRLLALLVAAFLAFVGAGTGTTNLLGDSDDADDGLDLSIDYSVTPDEPNTTPTPGANPSSSGGGGSPPADVTDPSERPETPADGAGSEPTTDEPWQFDDPDDEPLAASRPETTTAATVTPGEDPVTSSIPPVSVSGAVPGDGGVVDLSLSLSGSPARLWVRGTATDFAEHDLVEAERSAGDTGEPGELQEYVRVRLWYDGEGSDNVVYEGTLAGLNDIDGEDGWVPLTETCVPPGTHTARFRWELPVDAPNRVQTDSASFSLGVAAETSTCE
jgi:hypothetical protein